MTTRPRSAIKLCCSAHHVGRYARGPIPENRIIPNVMASIAYCDYQVEWNSPFSSAFAAAADLLRDFATVELLCEGLGITRKDLN